MQRREFITLIGGAAAAWPLAARAQQPDQVRRIAVLMAFVESDPEAQAWVAAFREGLQKLGWAEPPQLAVICIVMNGGHDVRLWHLADMVECASTHFIDDFVRIRAARHERMVVNGMIKTNAFPPE
jgi:hypothetical protein